MAWDELSRTERDNEVSLKVLGVATATRSYSSSRADVWEIILTMLEDGWTCNPHLDPSPDCHIEFQKQEGRKKVYVGEIFSASTIRELDSLHADSVCRLAVEAIDAWAVL